MSPMSCFTSRPPLSPTDLQAPQWPTRPALRRGNARQHVATVSSPPAYEAPASESPATATTAADTACTNAATAATDTTATYASHTYPPSRHTGTDADADAEGDVHGHTTDSEDGSDSKWSTPSRGRIFARVRALGRWPKIR